MKHWDRVLHNIHKFPGIYFTIAQFHQRKQKQGCLWGLILGGLLGHNHPMQGRILGLEE